MAGTRPMTSHIVDALARSLETRPLPGVLSVYLFGSHATGTAHAESDVDIAVLLERGAYPTERDRFEARVRLTAEIIARLHQNEIDVVILNDAPPLFARRIVSHGRRLYCADPEADRAFVSNILLRAADVAPFLWRMAVLKLAALDR